MASKYLIASDNNSFFYLSTFDLQSKTLADQVYQDSSEYYRQIIIEGERIYYKSTSKRINVLEEHTLAPIQSIQMKYGSIQDVVSNSLILAATITLLDNYVPAPIHYLKFMQLDNVALVDSVISGGRFDGDIYMATGVKQNVAYIKRMDQNVIRVFSPPPNYALINEINVPQGYYRFNHLLLDKDEENLLAFSSTSVFKINTNDYTIGTNKEYLPEGYSPATIVCIDQELNVIHALASSPNKNFSEIISYNINTDEIRKFAINSMPEYSAIQCMTFDPIAKLLLIGSVVYDNTGNYGLITIFDRDGKIFHQFETKTPPFKILITK